MICWALRGKIPFFNTIASYFNFSDTIEFWSRVAFTNALPRIVGSEEEKFSYGNAAMRAAVEGRARRLIQDVDPDKIIVFTTKGWQLFPHYDDRQTGGWLTVPGHDDVEFGGYIRTRSGHAIAYSLRHPMMAPWEMMRSKVAAIMAQ